MAKTRMELLSAVATYQRRLTKPESSCWSFHWQDPMKIYNAKEVILKGLLQILAMDDNRIVSMQVGGGSNLVEELIAIASSFHNSSPFKPAAKAYLPLLLDMRHFINECKPLSCFGQWDSASFAAAAPAA